MGDLRRAAFDRFRIRGHGAVRRTFSGRRLTRCAGTCRGRGTRGGGRGTRGGGRGTRQVELAERGNPCARPGRACRRHPEGRGHLPEECHVAVPGREYHETDDRGDLYGAGPRPGQARQHYTKGHVPGKLDQAEVRGAGLGEGPALRNPDRFGQRGGPCAGTGFGPDDQGVRGADERNGGFPRPGELAFRRTHRTGLRQCFDGSGLRSPSLDRAAGRIAGGNPACERAQVRHEQAHAYHPHHQPAGARPGLCKSVGVHGQQDRVHPPGRILSRHARAFRLGR